MSPRSPSDIESCDPGTERAALLGAVSDRSRLSTNLRPPTSQVFSRKPRGESYKTSTMQAASDSRGPAGRKYEQMPIGIESAESAGPEQVYLSLGSPSSKVDRSMRSKRSGEAASKQ